MINFKLKNKVRFIRSFYIYLYGLLDQLVNKYSYCFKIIYIKKYIRKYINICILIKIINKGIIDTSALKKECDFNYEVEILDHQNTKKGLRFLTRKKSN